MTKNKEKTDLDWHSGFSAATQLELRDEPFEFEREYLLNDQPIKIDVLVKREANFVSKNAIAHLFRKVNVMEYKSPDDGLTLEDYFKTVAYACLYIGNSTHVGSVDPEEVTVTLCREAYPKKLMENLQLLGYKLVQHRKGIYYVRGKTLFPTQILVTKEINKEQHTAYKMLTRKLQIEEAQRFLQAVNHCDVDTQKLADAVLQISINANKPVFAEIRRQNIMCEALQELFKDEIEEKIKTAVDTAVEKAVEKAEAKAEKAKAESDAVKAENARLRKYILNLGLNPNVVAEEMAPYGK